MSNRRPADPYNLCQFTFANGRMCGLPAHPKYDGLCLTHGRRRAPEPREDDLSHFLESPAGDYIYQMDINHILGKLFEALAANRVSCRRAATLAYIAGLLHQTQKGAKEEARRWEIDAPIFKKLVALKYPDPKDSSPAPGPQPQPETPQ